MSDRTRPALAAVTLGIALVPAQLAADTTALRKLKKGDTVEAEGTWDRRRGAFLATRIEKLEKPRRPSARGAIEALDRRTARLMIFRQEVGVSGETLFASASGEPGGGFSDLEPGMRIEVTAEVDETGAWTAKKLEWREVKASDKVKGTITDVTRLDGSLETVDISGLRCT